MGFTFHEADQSLVHMAVELIEAHYEDLADANIAIVLREEDNYRRKRPTFYGRAQLVPKQFTPWMDYDFLLIINEDEWTELNDAQCRALMDHLLCSCCLTGSGSWGIHQPDISEFSSVIQRHGFWSRELDRMDQAQQAYMQQRLPGVEVERITVASGGHVASITGAQLERLNDSLTKGE